MKTALTAFLTGILALATHVGAGEIVIPTFHDGQIHRAGTQAATVDSVANTIQTSKSGSNIHNGAYLFDFSSVPENYTVESADFQVTLSLQISNTASTAGVEFHGFASDTTIQPIDFDSPVSTVGSLLAGETFAAGGGNNLQDTELTIALDADKMQRVVDGSNDFFMLRSETVNFVTFQVHSSENTSGFAAPSLILNAFADADFNNDDAVDCTDVDALVGEICSWRKPEQF